MENVIRQTLEEIAKREMREDTAREESGSRAWRFASPDSDYDA